jgi:hypothetical protein
MNKNDQNIEYLETVFPFGTIYANRENGGKSAAIAMKYCAILPMRIWLILLPMGADGEI